MLRSFRKLALVRSFSSFEYDLVVIGGGSGGVATARRAAMEGVRTALVEGSPLGGTCVNKGCIPKKLYWYASDYSHTFEDSKNYGWGVTGRPEFDLKVLRQNKDTEIKRLNGIYENMLKKAGVDIFTGIGEISNPNTVKVVDNGKVLKELSGQRILIATGGKPWLPSSTEIEGIEHAETSNEFFEWDSLPKSVHIVGAGYIACELACILAALGTKVTMVVRGKEILRGFDCDIRAHVSQHMINELNIEIKTSSNVKKIVKSDNGLDISLSDGSVSSSDRILFATGRVPNLPQGLDVSLDKSGAIVVNEFSQSSTESIYAVGDVTNRMALTPVAIAEGKALVQTLYKGNPLSVSYENVPTAVFTQPEAASVGVAENSMRHGPGDASSVEGGVDVYIASFRPLKNTMTSNPGKVMMKILVAKESKKVVGCHVVGPSASEMIQCLAVAIKAGATKADFDSTIPLHPTSAEELVLMNSPTRSIQ